MKIEMKKEKIFVVRGLKKLKLELKFHWTWKKTIIMKVKRMV
jgi:hypothetical protein